ncbi:hypothetical protein CEXT_600681, partial [Caerostris extrusa]
MSQTIAYSFLLQIQFPNSIESGCLVEKNEIKRPTPAKPVKKRKFVGQQNTECYVKDEKCHPTNGISHSKHPKTDFRLPSPTNVLRPPDSGHNDSATLLVGGREKSTRAFQTRTSFGKLILMDLNNPR